MSLCISQSHRVLSAENKSTRTLTHNARSLTDTYTHTPRCTVGIFPHTAKRFLLGGPVGGVSLCPLPLDECPLIGMDGG